MVVLGDLKIINIITGVMSSSSTFPCAFCTINKKDLGQTFGTLRTIGSVDRSSESWIAGGAAKSNAKRYFNCAHTPLIHGNDETKILDVCPPPSLHLLLGIVNAIYNSVAEHNLELAQSWAKASSATRHAQFGFTGRHCHNLLKRRSMLDVDDLVTKQFNRVLDALHKVVGSCFGTKLENGYETFIGEFCNEWLIAQLPATPKFHIIQQHVVEFCQEKRVGLGMFSEQTTEAVHKDFSLKWEHYKVPKTSEEFPKKLLNCVVAYNSLHII